jgi:hypothetical protein
MTSDQTNTTFSILMATHANNNNTGPYKGLPPPYRRYFSINTCGYAKKKFEILNKIKRLKANLTFLQETQ